MHRGFDNREPVPIGSGNRDSTALNIIENSSQSKSAFKKCTDRWVTVFMTIDTFG